MHKFESTVTFEGGRSKLRGIKYFDLVFGHNYSSTKPIICAKLDEIGDWSCMILLGFLIENS